MHIEIKEGSELLAEMMKDDPDYRKYLEVSEKLEADPGLADRVHAFRRKNFDLQSSAHDPEQAMWDLNREYQDLIRNPLVNAYFEAEASVCRMMKEIMQYICSEVQLPEL